MNRQGSWQLDDQTKSTDSQRSNKDAVVFAVTSGKGGVGKTSISVSMATEFASRGFRTILVDTDLGLANTHILAGLKPSKTLSDYLKGRAELSEIVMDGPVYSERPALESLFPAVPA